MSRPLAAAALALMLAGCGDGRDAARDQTAEAQGPAADAPVPTGPSGAPSPAPVGAPADAASATPAPPAADADGKTAEAARALVERYYALLGRGDYAAARALWRNGGAASGKSPAAFARGFAGYASYRAEVGAPGRIDSGAGQRYVTVPVTVRATRKNGPPIVEQGEVTLHRAGDIDGATAEQRSWRIEKVDLASRNTTAADMPAKVTARYRCDDGTTLVAAFDNRADTVTLRRGNATLGVLEGQRPASGIWYAGDGMTLRGKGDRATFTRDGRGKTECTARA
ncbi:MliC family protein [Sphingomonas sp. ac-8]|uniref:MliC family protein n=1 Tax=Sphingomonas sp. ac-8 TaxID=3242977 RepID=UPI003A800314